MSQVPSDTEFHSAWYRRGALSQVAKSAGDALGCPCQPALLRAQQTRTKPVQHLKARPWAAGLAHCTPPSSASASAPSACTRSCFWRFFGPALASFPGFTNLLCSRGGRHLDMQKHPCSMLILFQPLADMGRLCTMSACHLGPHKRCCPTLQTFRSPPQVAPPPLCCICRSGAYTAN